MKIYVAGAGAGKTTSLARKIINKVQHTTNSRIIYCITFTNSAVTCIKNKIIESYGMIPSNVKISTIHSFLYSEIIKPYYFLLYGTQFQKISTIKLSNDVKTKKYEISKLEKNKELHQVAIPERAKWVLYKKSDDKLPTKNKRKILYKYLSKYIDAIFIDEAQDISEDIKKIIESLDANNIELIILGDPKQDLWGYGVFSNLLENNKDKITYSSECYRCPQKHLDITNRLIDAKEKQYSGKLTGDILVVYENDIDCKRFIDESLFDLKYIYETTRNFCTHQENDFDDNIIVESIDAVKGREGDNCLFILTTKLVPYLLGDKNENNKMLHKLYVALTRSKNKLTILITKEVDKKYEREDIEKVFYDKH